MSDIWSRRYKKGENRNNVMSLLAMGVKKPDVAKRLGISTQRVGQIRDIEIKNRLDQGHHWKDLQEKYHVPKKTMERIMRGGGYSQERWVERNRAEQRAKRNLEKS